jgi:hypothetical protein
MKGEEGGSGHVSFRRWASYAAAAALAHAGLFAAASAVRPREPAVRGRAVEPAEEATIDIVPESPTSTNETQSQATPPTVGVLRGDAHAVAARQTAAGALATREPSSSGEEGSSPAREPGEPSSEASAAPGESDWSFSPTKPLDVTAPSLVAQAVGEVVREGMPHTSSPIAGLAGALDDRDLALGLGRGGPVLSALEAVSRSMDVPIEGAATFDVAIDTTGHVSVALADVSNAAAAVGAVDVKRVHIPPGARGWHVVVRIDARVQYPDGSRPKDMGTHFEATPGEISKDSMVVKKLPGVTLSTRGKICSAGVSVVANPLMPIVVSGGCSPENAGMPAQRIVSGHILSEGRL